MARYRSPGGGGDSAPSGDTSWASKVTAFINAALGDYESFSVKHEKWRTDFGTNGVGEDWEVVGGSNSFSYAPDLSALRMQTTGGFALGMVQSKGTPINLSADKLGACAWRVKFGDPGDSSTSQGLGASSGSGGGLLFPFAFGVDGATSLTKFTIYNGATWSASSVDYDQLFHTFLFTWDGRLASNKLSLYLGDEAGDTISLLTSFDISVSGGANRILHFINSVRRLSVDDTLVWFPKPSDMAA